MDIGIKREQESRLDDSPAVNLPERDVAADKEINCYSHRFSRTRPGRLLVAAEAFVAWQPIVLRPRFNKAAILERCHNRGHIARSDKDVDVFVIMRVFEFDVTFR